MYLTCSSGLYSLYGSDKENVYLNVSALAINYINVSSPASSSTSTPTPVTVNVDLTPITVSFKAKPVDGVEAPSKEVASKQGQQRKSPVEEQEAQPPLSAPVAAAAEPAKQRPATPTETAPEAKEAKKGADKKKADKADKKS